MYFLMDHFRRFGWLYPALAVALAWPSIIGALRSPPDLDFGTIRQATAYQDQLLTEFSGPPAFEEFLHLWTEDHLNVAFVKDPRIRRLMEGMAGVAGERWITELDEIESTYGAVLDKWGSLDGQAAYAKSGKAYLARYEAEGLPGYLNLVHEEGIYFGYVFFNGRSARHRALAVRAIRDENWDEVMRQIRFSLGVWRPGYTTRGEQRGKFVSTAVDLYADLLAARPPRKVQEQCVDQISGLLKEVAALPDIPVSPASAHLPQMYHPFGLDFLPVRRNFEALGRLLTYRDRFRHPALQKWVADNSSGGEYLYSTRRDLNWTTAMVESRVLRLAAEHEPYVLEAHHLPADLLSQLDPFTLASTLSYDVFSASAGIRRAESIQRTRLLLLQVAFAAQLYRDEHGNWPSGIEDLYAREIMPYAKGVTLAPGMKWEFDTAIHPILPIRMGWLELDEDSFRAHWERWVHDSRLDISCESEEFSPEHKFEIRLGPRSEAEPVRALALAAFVKLRVPSVESVKVLYQLPRQNDPRGAGLTESFARELTERFDTLALGSLARSHEAFRQAEGLNREGLLHHTGGAPGTTGFLRHVELQMQLKPPERVFTIWSPGPDGIDDGGDRPYRSQDHEGNPIHRGDIVLFPEGL